MQPRSGDALGGTLVRQRRKVFRGRQRLYGLLARVSRAGSAKDRLYPIKERLFPPQLPHNSPHNHRGEKSHRKNKKPYIVFGSTFLIQYMVSVAGVAGFEPTNDGVRVRGTPQKWGKIEQNSLKTARFQSFFEPHSPITPQFLVI